ncbi:hypothetical protein [Marinicella meishanensis]|uniref:hypothetical protein n=1 Tax=Marinicella meishanensis TaxID=2873263 RepID=UPI001CBC7261|nr:hypothetical protein [Marinicella sp. NBU2979]
MIDDFTNIKIEVIINNAVSAEEFMNQVCDKYFRHYSGIAYIEEIKILRPEKF